MPPATKRRKLDQVDEITFDPTSRQEYLTGFHKRKQQRIQQARDVAAKREKEDKVKERRQIREQRKEELEKHVAVVNAELRKQNPDISDVDSAGEEDDEVEEWNGIEDGTAGLAQDEEYVDEDKYTTVTVEAMGESGDELDEGVAHNAKESEVKNRGSAGAEPSARTKKTWSKDPAKAKAKKRKFRYESKAERQLTRQKQKSKSSAAKARRLGK